MDAYEAALRAHMFALRARRNAVLVAIEPNVGTGTAIALIDIEIGAVEVELKRISEIEQAGIGIVPAYVSPVVIYDGGLTDFTVKSCDGKYETIMDRKGMYSVLRNGESWIDAKESAGDGYALSLLQLIETLDHKCRYYSDLAIKGDNK